MPSPATLRLRIRIDKGKDIAIGPGKIALLEAITDTGSITAAAKKHRMSYRRAWLLVDAMNRYFQAPVVDTTKGGKLQGGTVVTAVGQRVIRHYRSIESKSARATSTEIAALLRLLRK